MDNNFVYPSMTVLGCTGSVGEQAIDTAEKLNIKVSALAAGKNSKRVEEQARKFKPGFCALADPDAAKDLKTRLADTNIKVYSGKEGILQMIRDAEPDDPDHIVLNSITGEAGLLPTLEVINSGKKLALANKESLVIAGELVMKAAREHNIEILPVDSEHCAIFQVLRAGQQKEIKKILLTASGGPFFGYSREMLEKVTPEQALAHPTWKMGAKITIDSATLMNKGFEVIEAVHLFGVKPEQIQVVVHRESIIHSMVEYIDNSVIAQMAVPDMRHCVQYALTHPKRQEAVTQELDLFEIGKLTFAKPDYETFPLLALAFDGIRAGGALTAVINAANEVAVAAFLSHRIGFRDISEIVCDVSGKMNHTSDITDLSGIIQSDREARRLAQDYVNCIKRG